VTIGTTKLDSNDLMSAGMNGWSPRVGEFALGTSDLFVSPINGKTGNCKVSRLAFGLPHRALGAIAINIKLT
jgi:hypothetical protein